MIGRVLLLVVAVAALAMPVVAGAPAPTTEHYLPRAGDGFAYSELIVLNGGVGDYAGYTEHTFINGTLAVSAVASNESATTEYASSANFYNDSGGSSFTTEHGTFGWSASTFLYVNGTDNQTGYTNPSVWFFIDNTLGVGGSVTLLNTPMQVIGTNARYPMASSATGYVVAIETEGNGSFQRNDGYGEFTASYTWIAYFDPSTGYIIGYTYTEHDSNSSGDGFTWTDTLGDTHTSFPLTDANAQSSSGQGSTPSTPLVVLLVVLVVVVIIVVVVVVLVWRWRSHHGGPGMAAAGVPRHGGPGSPQVPPTYGAPPPVNLVPGGQPAIQQIVIRETVKVPCAFCGTLMDSTATVCPKCGAPRT
jgi:hypothetical protein